MKFLKKDVKWMRGYDPELFQTAIRKEHTEFKEFVSRFIPEDDTPTIH
jgi:hypothetical protein